VLCGRHKLAFNNIGNRRFRVTVSLWLDRYNAASTRCEKSQIVEQIVDVLYGIGARFFKKDEAREDNVSVAANSTATSASTSTNTIAPFHWIELSPKQVRAKVAHAIRDMVNNVSKDYCPYVVTTASSLMSPTNDSSLSTTIPSVIPSLNHHRSNHHRTGAGSRLLPLPSTTISKLSLQNFGPLVHAISIESAISNSTGDTDHQQHITATESIYHR
jgi:hypothetical protein